MALAFYIGAIFVFCVLSLLSFLRNGAILRGGAVAAMHGERKGDENASIIALQKSHRAPLPRPLDAPLSIPEAESSALRSTRNDSAVLAAGDAASPHSQSSEVFLQARRSAQLRRRKVKLIQQRGGDAAEVAAAEQEGVTASTGSDVASAWDPKQLCADDHIRLVFLFTFALPIYAFWCWELRDVRPPYLLYVYCYIQHIKAEDVSPLVQFALKAGPVFAPIVVSFVFFLYYAFFVYVDHRDKDVSLKRHNNTCVNRLVNWFKFRIYRKYVNFQCFLWKRYFSLQLVPAYGPLPLFLFPEASEGDGEEASGSVDGGLSPQSSRARSDSAPESAGRVTGGNANPSSSSANAGTPSRHYASATASARLNPFYVAVSSSSAGDTSPLDTPLHVRTPSLDAPAFLTARGSGSRAGILDAVTTADAAAEPALSADRRASGSDDWDEEELGQVRTRGGNSAARRVLQAPSREDLAREGAAADASERRGAAAQDRERSDSFSSSDLTKALRCPTPPPPAPPPMRRAHYFFAAHPHGILPWCCCVNLISNVTKRNAKLFVDNREAVLHPTPADDEAELGAKPSPQDARGGGQVASFVGSSLNGGGGGGGGAPLSSSILSSQHGASPTTSKANTFTLSNTRAMASPNTAGNAASLFSPSDTRREGDSHGLSPQPATSAPTTASVGGGVDGGAASTTPYAKGRYYMYHPSLKKFVLRLDKDEGVPASAADAAVYQERLRAAEAKKEAAAAAVAKDVKASSPSMRQRLKIRIRAVVATFPFYVPIMREIYMFHGYMDASYETCKRVLLYNNSTRREREGRAGAAAHNKAVHARSALSDPAKRQVRNEADTSSAKRDGGSSSGENDSEEEDDDDEDESSLPDDLNHLMLFPGGASEALLSDSHGPARVLLRRRKGFLRLALHTQSGLVPVYTFGETDYFDQFSTTTTRYAAPLEDDSTFFSKGASANEDAHEAAGAAPHLTGATTTTTSTTAAKKASSAPATGGDAATQGQSATVQGPLSVLLPRCLDRAGEGEKTGRQASTSTRSRSPRSPPLPFTKEAQQSRRKALEQRLLRDEEDARDREGRVLRSPAQPQASFSGAGGSRSGEAKTPRLLSPTTRNTSVGLSTGGGEGARDRAGHGGGTGEKVTADTSTRAGRLPRIIQAVQRLFQETFGISLPVVRNLIPHRVTGATVVGRPIYFELPPDLQRMYTDPANYYDREKERAVLLAAQEIYFNELQELFLKYAPRYLKDPSRRKLEIL